MSLCNIKMAPNFEWTVRDLGLEPLFNVYLLFLIPNVLFKLGHAQAGHAKAVHDPLGYAQTGHNKAGHAQSGQAYITVL